jgi:hypothetical protein
LEICKNRKEKKEVGVALWLLWPLIFDETLYSFDEEVREAFFELAIERNDKSILRGAYSNNQEWRNLVDHDKGLAYEAIERVHENATAQVPFKNSVDVVNRIAEKHTVKYVGSRFQKHWWKTTKWLEYWDFPNGELICVEPNDSKQNYFDDVQYLFDDRPRTIIEFIHAPRLDFSPGSPHPRLAFGLWRQYNQNLTDVRNVLLAPTWRGIEYYLERKGVI